MESEIPRIIWILWLQGWDAAPDLAQACLRSWRSRNPGWDVRAIDRDALAEHLDVTGMSHVPPAALSDYIRVHLLDRIGGVWVDATVFCVRPLDEWLQAPTGFFAFRRPKPGLRLASWFLCSAPGNPAVARWAKLVDAYWDGRRERDRYFWFHALFDTAYRTDPTVRRIWDGTPKHTADDAHYFVPYTRRLTRPMTRLGTARLAMGHDPVYKLDHRIEPTLAMPGSAFVYFLNDASTPLEPSRLLHAADSAVEAVRWVGRDLASWAVPRARGLRRRITGPRRGAAPNP